MMIRRTHVWCAFFLLCLCLCLNLTAAVTLADDVAVDAEASERRAPLTVDYEFSFSKEEVVGVLEQDFGGYNLDWWHRDKENYGDSGILLIDFSNPLLNKYTRGLGPGYLRVGGAMQDAIIYNASHFGDCTNPNLTFVPANSTAPFDHYNKPKPDYRCHHWLNGSEYGCLTTDRWTELSSFAARNKGKLVFGLSACYGRPAYDEPMDMSNIAHFVNITVQSGIDVHAFEFGNEKLLKHVGVKVYAADTVSFIKNVLRVFYPLSSKRPLLVVPDTDKWQNVTTMRVYLREIARLFGKDDNDLSEIIDALSFHIYPKCANDLFFEIWDLKCLKQYKQSTKLWVALAREFNISRVYLGETGEASGGGRDKVTNVWMSSFWYTYTLATVASASDKVTLDLFRQTLTGGYYELLSHFTAQPSPNADYWLLYLWKRLVGSTALSCQLRTNALPLFDSLCAFSFTAKNVSVDALAVFINFSKMTKMQVSLSSSHWRSFELTSDKLTSRKVYVNGELMRLNATEPRDSHGEDVVVIKPQTIVFLEFLS